MVKFSLVIWIIKTAVIPWVQKITIAVHAWVHLPF